MSFRPAAFYRGAGILLGILLAVMPAALISAHAQSYGPWDSAGYIFLRGGRAITAGENLVELAAAGDTSLARGINPGNAFALTSGWLRSADIAFANLECAITQEPALPGVAETSKGPYRLIAPVSAGQSLRQSGLKIVSLANNHSLDAGPAGLEETVRVLRQAGIATIGAGENAQEASSPVVISQHGVRLAFLAFNAVTSPDPSQPGWTIARWQLDEALAAVRRAKIAADAVIVSVHWGFEYERRADSAQIEWAQDLTAAGADLVIGHHPHTVQEILVQPRADGSIGLAAMSLGNFAFDQGAGASGLAMRAFFDGEGLRAVQVLPVRSGLRPRLGKGLPLPKVEQSRPNWETVHITCSSGSCSQMTEGNTRNMVQGIFTSGQVDLTGDGQPEEVRLVNHHIFIYKKNKLDWESPREWRVLDLAIGDPDGDGRNDLAVALEKPDKNKQIQSHPFLIGYRGGVYRTIWGGSPVGDPLREIELSDVNGDGQPELIVLEEAHSGKGRAVTVWHWHGWGFSLDWRSTYGQYEDLVTAENNIWVKSLPDR